MIRQEWGTFIVAAAAFLGIAVAAGHLVVAFG